MSTEASLDAAGGNRFGLSELLVEEDILEYFDISRVTLGKWKRNRGFPQPLIPGKKCKYRKHDVVEWVNTHR